MQVAERVRRIAEKAQHDPLATQLAQAKVLAVNVVNLEVRRRRGLLIRMREFPWTSGGRLGEAQVATLLEAGSARKDSTAAARRAG